ncbi:IS91 family transposase [Puniceicoccus vermicola]|uniref:Transposase n=2 Tax=Puniceicoccus vermicola TaxID=388746 RepID=A0A7X1E684_9BACT|nr:transposase [Puniceicoccus vermicola]
MSGIGQLRCPREGESRPLTVARVIERFAPAYWERYGSRMRLEQRKALQAILQCRTPALGGHRYACGCGHEHHAFHSCNHRLCPRCGAADTQEWVRKQLGKLLPVPYYLVTFTVPSELRSVMLGNRQAMELLMGCSARALNELLADPARGCRFDHAGFFGVYQSWTQDMRFHPHVHYVVPAVGLDERWKLKHPKSPKFLIHAQPLAIRLRTLLTNALRDHGPIRDELFWKLAKTDWNADVDRAGNGENAVKYLGQYIRRSVISDHRILALEGNRVRIRIKNRDTVSFETRTLDGVEFVRRFLLHALPDRFHRIRYRGFLHARGKPRLLWLQLLLDAKLQPPPESTPVHGREIACPRCGGPMRKIKKMPRAPPAHRNEHFFHAVAA